MAEVENKPKKEVLDVTQAGTDSVEDKPVGKTLHTVNDFVLIEYVDREVKIGNIVIDQNKSGKDLNMPITSRVLALNASDTNGLEVGDEILFYRHACEEINIQGKKALIIMSKAIMGVYK